MDKKTPQTHEHLTHTLVMGQLVRWDVCNIDLLFSILDTGIDFSYTMQLSNSTKKRFECLLVCHFYKCNNVMVLCTLRQRSHLRFV